MNRNSESRRDTEGRRNSLPGNVRLNALRRQAANEPGRLAITDEATIRRLARAGRGGSY